MHPELEQFESDFERAEYLQNLLIEHATDGGDCNSNYYVPLRAYFVSHPELKKFVPRWVRDNRETFQFWEFIKYKFTTYKERRKFIWDEFRGLFDYLESLPTFPPKESINEILKKFDFDRVNFAWRKARERISTDPEGAITMARTLIESVCKHILDARGVEYNAENIELSRLYKLTAEELNLAPDQHLEKVFKQILGGCSAVVNGLGTLRNKIGDAHGTGAKPVKPSVRHAELAVNLAGVMAQFLIQTHEAKKQDGKS